MPIDDETLARLGATIADAVVERLGPLTAPPGWPEGRGTISEPEAAAYLGIGQDYLRELRQSCKIAYTAQGRRVTYSARDIGEYMDRCRRTAET